MCWCSCLRSIRGFTTFRVCLTPSCLLAASSVCCLIKSWWCKHERKSPTLKYQWWADPQLSHYYQSFHRDIWRTWIAYTYTYNHCFTLILLTRFLFFSRVPIKTWQHDSELAWKTSQMRIQPWVAPLYYVHLWHVVMCLQCRPILWGRFLGHMQDLTEQDNKAQFKGKWIRNRTYKINITVWRYRTRTGSQCNLGWTSLNGQSSVVVCRWQRWHISSRLGLSMVIFFQDRTQCAWFAARTQWLITIHSLHYSSYSLFSLLHNLILSLLSALSTNSLFLAHLPVALDDLQNILSTSGEFQLSVMRACAQYPVRE